MPTEGIGLYPLGTAATLNTEVSSTYEGRHLTFLGTDITTHDPAHTLQQKGHPCMVDENIVGVAFTTETAVGEGLYVAIDTEGIWYLSVTTVGSDLAVTHGDEIYINKTTAELSNISNKNTHARFGYALGGVAAGVAATIAVKVHWNPDDAEEQVGTRAVPYVNDTEAIKFREYYYDAGGGGLDITGDHLELTITHSTLTAFALYRRLTITDDPLSITGRCAVGEFRLEIAGAGALNLPTMGVISLDYSNAGSASPENFINAYIFLRDRHPGIPAGIRRLLHFHDIAALADGAGGANSEILVDCNAAKTHDISVKCSYGATGIEFWLMGHSTAPD